MVTRTAKPLAAWMEDTLRLPSGPSATAGPITLHPYKRAIADPRVERVSVLKSARAALYMSRTN